MAKHGAKKQSEGDLEDLLSGMDPHILAGAVTKMSRSLQVMTTLRDTIVNGVDPSIWKPEKWGDEE